MQSVIQRSPDNTHYHHRQHSHDGTFHLNFREMQRGTQALVQQKGDHWWCAVASPLNELLISVCRSWRHTNRPIVTSRPMAWPLISRIDMRDSTVFDMMSPESMERLRAYMRKNGQPSFFGMIRDASGAADRYDERIRLSTEIKAQKIFAIQDTDLYKMCTRLLRQHWGLERCSLHLYKMLLYDAEDSGHFEYHRDAVHAERHVGTLVISLESPDCRGGRVVFKDFADEECDLVKPCEYRMEDMLKLYMFYTDTEHRVEPVTRGYRIMLQYEIIVDECDTGCELVPPEKDKFHYDTDVTGLFEGGARYDDEPTSPLTLRSIDLFSEREFSEHCATRIVTWLKNAAVTQIPALMMSHLYPIADIEPDTLRGFDRLMYKILDPHFEIEFMPVCLFAERDRVSRCVSLHRNRNHHEKRDLVLYVTPATVHCTDSLHGAYMGGADRAAPHLNYTAVAMILNKTTKF